MQFLDFSLDSRLLEALDRMGFSAPTPIQEQAIPPALQGLDVLGAAQTGTGKTAAFALPILHHLLQDNRFSRDPRVLVLTPTRELAAQVGDTFRALTKGGKLKTAVIFGGVSQVPQEKTLARGVDILVATPGRLLDLVGQGILKLDKIQVFVLDEADRMLDMGFIHDIRRIVPLVPVVRQTLLFSATFPQEIKDLTRSLLKDPVEVSVTPEASTPELIHQKLCFVDRGDKTKLLMHLLEDPSMDKVLVFTRTKHGANKLAVKLTDQGFVSEAIHGNKSQSARERALAGFKTGAVRVLVATDLASRGIHINEVSHVINYELPNEPESYVHRIGRTGRAGAEGEAIAFCDFEERDYLRDIEALTGIEAELMEDYPFAADYGRLAPKPVNSPRAPRPDRAPESRGPGGREQGRRSQGGRGQDRQRTTGHGPQHRNGERRRSEGERVRPEGERHRAEGGRGDQPGGTGGRRRWRKPQGQRSGGN